MFYRRFIYFFKPHSWTFFIGFIFVIIANLSSSYTNRLVELLIDGILGDLKNGVTDFEIIKSKLIQFILTFLGLTVLSAVFTFLMRQTIVVASRKIEQRMKSELYNHIQRLSISEYKSYPIGDLMSRMSEDIGKIREIFGPSMMYIVNMITSVSVAVFFMYQIHPKLTLYALIPLPFLSIFIYIFNQFAYRLNTKLQEHLSSLTSIAQEAYNGIRIVKSFTLESKIFNKFSDKSLEYKAKALSIVKIDSLFFPVTSLLMGFSILISIFYGGQLYFKNEISLGGLTAFIMFVNRLLWPVMSIGWVANSIQRGKASLTRYFEIMNLPVELTDGESLTSSSSADIAISFDQVSFTYPETGIKAIDNLSFEVRKGEKWMIIGKTGSGKSTLAELMMKFYPDFAGKISVFQSNIKTISNQALRQSISYIPQDLFLFSDTIENNIKFSDSNKSLSEATKSAQSAQIHDEINQFKDTYQTIVGERGITLSGGQKQRLSIARALMKPAPIFLFDDCLSAVDVETEMKLIQALNSEQKDSTMVLITHRIFNQLQVDKILVLHEGQMIELGSHQELMDKKGYYYEIYQKQELK